MPTYYPSITAISSYADITLWVSWLAQDTGTATCDWTQSVHNVWRTWASSGNTNITLNSLVTSGEITIGYDYGSQRLVNEAERLLRAEFEAEQAVRVAEQAERTAKHVASVQEAKRRARQLLMDHLTPEQQQELERFNAFVVISERGNRYRIYQGQAGNIRALDVRGLEHTRFCIHPRQHNVPNEDAMLLQKLMLETDEERFLKVANRS